jgi:hypothetical protein
MHQMKIGDLVRVKQGSGKLSTQRYEVRKIGPRPCYCEIVQWPAINPRREAFDTSLLVVDNSGPAMLANRFRR